MASIWEDQSGKEESLLASRKPLHQWHQSHGPALGVLGPESVTCRPMEHPWGDKHEAKYQFTYTKIVWWLRCCCTDWNTLVPWWNTTAYACFQCLHNPRPICDMSLIRAVVKHSGGVAVFVNDAWSDCVSLWKQSTDGTRLWLQFQRSGAAPLFLAVMYAPPKGSPYADEGLFDNIAIEVNMIQDLGGSILLIGDFNARTNAADDYVDCR